MNDITVNQFFSAPIPLGLPIAPIGNPYNSRVIGGDFNNNDLFYGILNYNTLVKFDLITGNQTTLKTITGVTSGQSITSLGYFPGYNTMYLGTTDLNTSQFYTLNLSTGAATSIRTVTNCPGLIAIAINNSGQIFGVDIVNDNLILIDPVVGNGTIIGSLGYDANYTQDADFDFTTKALYI